MRHPSLSVWLGLFAVTGCRPVSTTIAKVSTPGQVNIPNISSQRIPDQEIIGEYYQGDGLGSNLSLNLQKDHKFSYMSHGCLGVYDKAKGTWNRDGDLVILHPRGYKGTKNPKELDSRFVPVRAKGQYLIEENSMPAFASEVSERDPRTEAHGFDYIRLYPGSSKVIPAKGVPVMPQAYIDYYVNGSIETVVTKTNPDGTVDLKPDPKNRLKPNLRLIIRSLPSIELRVLSASKDRVTAQPFYFEQSDKPIAVGMKFTTGGGFFRIAPDSEKRLIRRLAKK